ncbi:MAG: bifunctional protein-serine/threonine kinase/phosphatase [Methylococcales bacterium]|nr:bifunctional protein-serine/threonine kinase/phosphatase [Methylococcales bacterium]
MSEDLKMTAVNELSVSIAYASDKGIKEENEDFFGSLIPEGAQLTHKGISVGIADGMSGCEAGKEASQCCIVSFLNDYYSTPDSWTIKKSGQKILSATNSWLYSQGQIQYESSKGMVSTLSVLVFKSTTAHIFHIGDSRIYRLRKGRFEQMTRDHRIFLSKDKNYLSRAMGIEPRLEVDYKAFPLERGDVFLMTTDGIHDFIEDKNLKNCLQTGHNLQQQAQAILNQAVDNKSDDNLTCQIIKIEQLPPIEGDEVLRRHVNIPFPPLLKVGMLLDGYRIEEELHASNRTQIYKAFDTETQSRVILKTPSILFNDDTHYIEHFLHEEWAGKRIQHKNVLKILNLNKEKSYLYYVTEYIEGQTLRQWIDASLYPKEISEIREIIEQVVKGLRAFHRMEMLHQDLKPENIMIDRNNVVKIIDFGSVKIAGIAEITPLDYDKEENILGTLNYSAPEYHLGQTGTIQSDIYSLGVITYEMINHALPYGQMPEKPNKINLAKLRYISSFHHNTMVPAWIDGALKKSTSLNPQLRYEHLSEFIYDLSAPNTRFLSAEENIPFIEGNPLLFWKSLTALLFLSNLVLIYWFN